MGAWLQGGRAWIERCLERRIAAYSVAAIFSISLIFGAASLATSVWLIKQHQYSDLENRLGRVVARLDNKADVFVRSVEDLSKNPIVFSALLDSRGRDVYLLPFFKYYQFPLEEPHSLALCDFEGKLLAQRKLHLVGCLTEWPQSQAVIDTEQSQVLIIAIMRKPHLALFQPVFYPGTGRAEGYILATLDLQVMIADPNLVGPHTTITLRSADGRLQFAVQGGAIVTPPVSTREQPSRTLFTRGPFALTGLMLTLDEPIELLTGIAPVLIGYGLGTLILLVVTLALSYRLARRLAKPLLILNHAARRITAEGLSTDLIISDRTDEIGELTVSFNRMITALRQAQEGLEDQVRTRTVELQQALVTIKQSDDFTHTILDSVPYQIAVLDRNGVISMVNEPWRRFALENSAGPDQPAQRTGIGANYLEICREAVQRRGKSAMVAYDGIQAVLAGQRTYFTLEYPCHSPHQKRWFLMRATPLNAIEGGVVIAHANITERKEVEHLITIQRDLLLTLEQVSNPIAAMQAILEAALRLYGVDSGGIYEVNPEDDSLVLRVHHGLSAAYIAAVQIRTSDSPAGQIVRTGQPHYNFSNLPYSELPNYFTTEGLRAVAVIPILHDGHAIACFNLASHQVDTIPAATCRALETLALQLGGVLARFRTQAELEEQRINLSAVFDTLEDFLFILDPQGRILQVNPAVERRLGYTQQELLGHPVLKVHPPDQHEEARRIVAAMLAGQMDLCPVPLLTRGGQQIPVETRVVPGQWNGQPALIGLSRDITEHKRMEAALQEQAIRDSLTGLFNRRYLDETLPRELNRCRRSGEPLTVTMLDLDHFKNFNDIYGHEAGDAVLRAVGDLLIGSLRASDVACRYGGEEFTVVMPGSTLDDARTRLDTLRQILQQLRVLYRDRELPIITISVGVATTERADINASTLLEWADAALYQAKKQGRNRLVVATQVSDL